MYVILHNDAKELPIFGYIKHVFRIENDDFYFGIQKVRSLHFENNFHSYEVEHLHDHCVIRFEEMFSPLTAISHTMSNGLTYIMPRSAM